jgi:ABC-type glycerol-3-phosphate transport system substrate-binding protein
MLKRLFIITALLLVALSGCSTDKKAAATDAPALSEAENEAAGTPASQEPNSSSLLTPSPDMIAGIAVSESMEESGTLRIGLYFEDDVTKKALAIFKEKYPGWDVEVTKKVELENVVYDEDGKITEGNTVYHDEVDIVEMLEDNELDLINAETYSFPRLWSSGLLQDLMLMFQNDTEISLNNMLPQIRDLFMYEGKLPLIPVWFSTNFLIPHPDKEFEDQGEIPDSWTWPEAVDWHMDDFKANDVELFIPGYSEQWILDLLSDNYM